MKRVRLVDLPLVVKIGFAPAFALIMLAFLAVGWFRHQPWFRARITVPCCYSIAAIGLFLTLQRIFF